MRELKQFTDKEYLHDAHNGAWKGLLKGAMIGLAVGVGMYFAGIGLAALHIPIVSSALAAKGLSAFSTVGMIGFAAFNSIFFGVSGAINGAVQENTERKARNHAQSLEAKITELEAEQGKDTVFRKRTEALLEAVEQESSFGDASNSRSIQDILSKGQTSQGSFADKVMAERELAETREAAL